MSLLTDPTPELDGPLGAVVQNLKSRRAFFGLVGIAAGAGLATAAGLGAAPAHAAGNRMVVWSTGANRVYLVEDGKIKRTMKCIDNDWKTPAGTYSIWRWELAYSFYQGKKIWLENFAPFYRRPGATGNIGFHRVPIWAEGKNKGKQIHSNSKLGDKSIESEGCIRLSDADIKATKKFAPAGTKIVVQKAAYKGGKTSTPPKKESKPPANNSGVPAFPAGLRPGAHTAAAVTLQRQLKAAGFMPKSEPEAPIYGPATQKAVGKFHNKHTQFRDRVSDPAIGPKGWNYLFSHYKGGNTSTPPKTSKPKPSEPSPKPSKPSGGKTYTVKSGDTLGSIASRHKVKGGWQAIAKKNGLSNPNFIRIGQKLILP